MSEADDERLAAAIRRLVRERGPGKTICPSEAARAVAPEAWRPLLGPTRRVAARLAVAGEVGLFRKGKPIPPEEMRGVIRLGLPGEKGQDE